ncbi:MAG: hypothetical protein ORN28_05120, partial [Rhodoferax sp.]|nr:hypothetical protein [Rhodoferax sp.]
MGFWHPGLNGVYDPASLEIPKFRPTPSFYTCESCSKKFSEIEKLRRHRFEQHPVRQPALWLRGRAVGALPQLLMTR